MRTLHYVALAERPTASRKPDAGIPDLDMALTFMDMAAGFGILFRSSQKRSVLGLRHL